MCTTSILVSPFGLRAPQPAANHPPARLPPSPPAPPAAGPSRLVVLTPPEFQDTDERRRAWLERVRSGGGGGSLEGQEDAGDVHEEQQDALAKYFFKCDTILVAVLPSRPRQPA